MSEPRRSRVSLRRVFTVASVGWLLYLLEPLSSPGLSFPRFLLAFWITVFFGAGALVGVLGRTDERWRVVVWLVHPLAACALTLLFLFSQSPANPLFRARFLVSRPALDAAATAALDRGAPAAPAWIGLFRVRRIDADPPREVRYVAGGCGVVDECGLVFMAAARPAARGKTRLKPLGGPWYHLYSMF